MGSILQCGIDGVGGIRHGFFDGEIEFFFALQLASDFPKEEAQDVLDFFLLSKAQMLRQAV